MIRQKSFEGDRATLYLVPTPIGNLQEMTPRALEILKKVDCVAAEDTRHTQKLLSAYSIKKPLFSHHEHNQKSSIPKILKCLKQGQNIAVVSDAGYPLISDPGQQLIEKAIEQGHPVVSLSGAHAATCALVASGLSCQHYLFYGFLDSKTSKRKKALETLKTFPYTILFYEAPHRIEAMLKDVFEVFGDRKMVLARELTKIHEEYIRGSIREVLEVAGDCKGEMVIVVEGCSPLKSLDVDQMIEETLEQAKEMRLKDAVKQVAEKYGYSKNQLYQEIIKRREHANR